MIEEELDKEQASYKLSGECCDENESLATWSSGSRGGQEGPWRRIYVTMISNELAAGPKEGRARKDQGAMVPTVLGKEGMRRQVGNRESKDHCGSPPRPHSTTPGRV